MIGHMLGRKSPLLASMIYTQALVLVRSAVMARFLGPEQFGLAMIFVLIQQFLDMSTDVGINKYILSASDGHRKAPQRVLHAISLARSTLLAFALILIAYPVLHFFDARLTFLPFAILAAATMVAGAVHSDNIREQRVEAFRGQSASAASGETAALLFTLVYLQVSADYLVALYAILVRMTFVAAVSQILARRPYRLEYDRELARPIWRFALPLIVNGPLLFFSGQADRLLVASTLGPSELGIYSATLLLILSPASLYARYLGAIYLPKISRGERRKASADKRRFTLIMVFSAAIIAIGFAAIGPTAVALIFGTAFWSPFATTAMIGVIQALRFLHILPSTVLLSAGRTDDVLKSNIVRLITLPCTALGFVIDETLFGMLTGLLAGELIALSWALKLAFGSKPFEGTAKPEGVERATKRTSD